MVCVDSVDPSTHLCSWTIDEMSAECTDRFPLDPLMLIFTGHCEVRIELSVRVSASLSGVRLPL